LQKKRELTFQQNSDQYGGTKTNIKEISYEKYNKNPNNEIML